MGVAVTPGAPNVAKRCQSVENRSYSGFMPTSGTDADNCGRAAKSRRALPI
jgi:hypothetical protein